MNLLKLNKSGLSILIFIDYRIQSIEKRSLQFTAILPLLFSLQEYEMNCLLCGHGEDSRSIMPRDPRQQPLFIG